MSNDNNNIDIKKILLMSLFIFLTLILFNLNFFGKEKEEIVYKINDYKDFKKEEKKIISKKKYFFYNKNSSNNIIDSDLKNYSYYIEYSNLGAKINNFFLINKYNNIPMLNNYNNEYGYLNLLSKENDSELNFNTNYEFIVDNNNNSITFFCTTSNKLIIEKKYSFNDIDSILNTQIVLSNNSNISKRISLNLVNEFKDIEYSKNDLVFSNSRTKSNNVLFYNEMGKFKNIELDNNKNFKNYIVSESNFIGINEKFLVSCIFPLRNFSYTSFNLEHYLDNNFLLSLNKEIISINPNESYFLFFNNYLGIKDFNKLSSLNHSLKNIINYGIFEILINFILLMLNFINNYFNNFGLSIIILTFFFKILTYPLTKKSFDSMKKMKLISSDIKILQDKYADDKFLFGQKQMELYKEKGIHPFSGCLPTIIQIPLWVSLYQALLNSTDIFRIPFLWLNDLALPDNYFILPILILIISFLQNFTQPSTSNTNQSQMKIFMFLASFIMVFFSFILPSGLTIFILFNSLISFLHQLYTIKKNC